MDDVMNWILLPSNLKMSHRITGDYDKFKLVYRDYESGKNISGLIVPFMRFSKKEAIKELRKACRAGAQCILQRKEVITIWT